MGTLRQYFDHDFLTIPAGGVGTAQSSTTIAVNCGELQFFVTLKLCHDLDANSKYWMVYSPSGLPKLALLSLLEKPEIRDGRMPSAPMGGGFLHLAVNGRSTEKTVFTGRVFYYVDDTLSEAAIREITEHGRSLGLDVTVRETAYATTRSIGERPLAFISHDSADKADVARPLAQRLIELRCPVWYDEFTLKIGDNLRESIDNGIRNAHRCVLVLSPAYFSNKGWGRAEYDSIFTREMIEKDNIILPIWHNVGKEDVFQYSTWLPSRVGLKTSLGIEVIAQKIAGVLRPLANP